MDFTPNSTVFRANLELLVKNELIKAYSNKIVIIGNKRVELTIRDLETTKVSIELDNVTNAYKILIGIFISYEFMEYSNTVYVSKLVLSLSNLTDTTNVILNLIKNSFFEKLVVLNATKVGRLLYAR